jgi:putative membrane protein
MSVRLSVLLPLLNVAAGVAVLASSLAYAADPLSSSDKSWAEKAARANSAEILAGNLASTNAKRADLKSFGQMMAKDHGGAGNELKTIATGKGLTLPDTPDKAHQKEIAKLEKMTDEKFDKEYLKEAAVKDHKDAVKLCEKGAKDLKDPDLKAFAQKTLPTIQRHMAMANDMAKSK